MRAMIGLVSLVLTAAACDGRIVQVGSVDQNTAPGGSANNDSGGASSGPPSTPAPQPSPPGAASVIIVAATTSNGGRFTALAPYGSDPLGMYVAETVLDTSGASTAGTTLWRVRIRAGGTDTGGMQKTAIVSGPSIGIPVALALRTGSTNPADANLIWIDATSGSGALKNNTSGGVAALAAPFVGAAIVIDDGGRSSNGPDLPNPPPGALGAIYADYNQSRCVARIEDAMPSCVAASYDGPLHRGSGLHLVRGTLYAADSTQLYTVNVDTNLATTVALPDAIRTMDQPVFDVAPGPNDVVYLATRSGVWKKDAANVFSQVYAGAVTQQFEMLIGTIAYANVVGTGLVRIDLTDYSSRVITTDIAINTRFAWRPESPAGPAAVFWINAAQTSLLQTEPEY